MSIGQSMLGEFDYEMANTRKTLERVPDDKLDWQPHPKSMTMGQLASHIAEMVGWTGITLTEPSYEIAPDFKPFAATSNADLMKKFDEGAASARAAIEKVDDAALMAPWKLIANGAPMFEMPRIAVLRSMIMNHVIHHRAQLGVYFRLNGIPVPALYGPSADEGQPAAAAG